MAEHAVGSRISLISNSEIRYEGFLHFINAKENTVGLKNVRMFGTEGRRNGQNEVQSNNQLYEYIVFRGADIKDLTVFDDQIADPAVISATPAKNDPNGNAWQQGRDHRGRGGAAHSAPAPATSGRGGARGGYGGHSNQQQNNHQGGRTQLPQPASHGNAPAQAGGRGRGGFQDRRPAPASQAAPAAPAAAPRQRHEHTGREFAPITGAPKEFKDDFDFAKAQTDFHELDGRDSVKKAYDKGSSFFDNLSSDVTDRQANRGPQRQAFRDQQKKVDGETFGNEFVGAHQSSRYRRGGGGRGRGRFQARN